MHVFFGEMMILIIHWVRVSTPISQSRFLSLHALRKCYLPQRQLRFGRRCWVCFMDMSDMSARFSKYPLVGTLIEQLNASGLTAASPNDDE